MKKENKVLYPKLRAKLAFYGDNQETLAKIVGVGKVSISQRLSGRIEWKVTELQKIAQHYNCTIDELL